MFETCDLGLQEGLDGLWRRECSASLHFQINGPPRGQENLFRGYRHITARIVSNQQNGFGGRSDVRHVGAPVARARLSGTDPAQRKQSGGEAGASRENATRVKPLTRARRDKVKENSKSAPLTLWHDMTGSDASCERRLCAYHRPMPGLDWPLVIRT